LSFARERPPSTALSGLLARALDAPVALTLAGLVLLSFVARLALAGRVPVPYLLPDEVIYARMAEELRETGSFGIEGRPPNVLYPVLLAPAWFAGSMETTYDLVRTLNAALWSLAAVPVYLWARRLVAPGYSLLAALLTLLMPAGVLTSGVMAENVLLPAFVLACWALAAALERPTPLRQLLAFAAIGLAVAARLQAVVLLAVVPLAILLKVAFDARAGRRPREELLRFRPSAVVLGFAAVAYIGVQLARGRSLTGGLGAYSGAVDALSHPGEVARWSVVHLGELVFAAAAIPAAALIMLVAWAWQSGSATTPAERAFLAVAATAVPIGIVPAGAVAVGFDWVVERYTFQLLPLLFIAFALWLGRDRPHPPAATALALAIPAILVLSLPLESLVDTHPANMLSLAALARLSDHLGGMDEMRLVVAGGLLVAGALFVLARGRASSVAVVVAVAGFLAFASNSVFDYTRTVSRELRVHAAGAEPTWIDLRIGQGAHAAYVYIDRPNEKDASTVLMQTGFWNRSLDEVVELEGNPVDVQPRHSVTVDEATGEVVSAEPSVTAAPYAVSPHEVVLVGERIAEAPTLASPLVLYRLHLPLRIAFRTEGVFPDGWTGETASLTQYAGASRKVEVSLSREAVTRGAPAEVELRLGPVERRGGEFVMASVNQRRIVGVPNASTRVVTLPVPAPPYRLELSVTPTFRPAEFGSADTRELGVQVEFKAIGSPRS
jgi:Dolichyl-phosphate-mannose-protein mannosyltransferase